MWVGVCWSRSKTVLLFREKILPLSLWKSFCSSQPSPLYPAGRGAKTWLIFSATWAPLTALHTVWWSFAVSCNIYLLKYHFSFTLWADLLCAPNCLDTCFTNNAFANEKGQVTAEEGFQLGSKPGRPQERGWSVEVAPGQLEVCPGSSSGAGAGAMLEENLHLPCTSPQVSSRPRDSPTLEGIQGSPSAPQQRRVVRFVLPGVWHR